MHGDNADVFVEELPLSLGFRRVKEENKEQEECHGCGVGEQSKKGEIR